MLNCRGAMSPKAGLAKGELLINASEIPNCEVENYRKEKLCE